MVCSRLKRHVLNYFIFSDYDSLRDAIKKKKKNHDRTVNIDKEKYEINIFLFSCVRKYSLCGFRKINTNLLYTLNSYNM